MLALLGISTIASLIGSTVIGVRLLRLYGRSKQVPELIMGSSFILGGVIGYIFMLVGTGGAAHMRPELARAFFLIGYALISLAVILTYVFVWRVFRAESKLARVFMGIVCPVVAVTALPLALPNLDDPGAVMTASQQVVFWLGHGVRVGAGAWGAVEAGHYWLAMRRRMRIGLADAVVTNRIALWGFASVGSVIVFASTAVENAKKTSMDQVLDPAQIILISTVSFTVVMVQWLAFLAPDWYLRLLRRRESALG